MTSIITHITGRFSSGPFYVRIRRDRLIVRNSSNGETWDDIPVVAIETTPSGQKVINAIGKNARNLPNLVNPFDHPRLIIKDFIVAERLLQYAFRALTPHSWIRPAPIAILHVTELLEGGITEIEKRALREMAEGAGARTTYLWQGHELLDQEIQAGVYRNGD